MFAIKRLQTTMFFPGVLSSIYMHHRLILTPRRSICKSVFMNIYLSGGLQMTPSRRLSQRPFVGSILLSRSV